MSAGREAVLRSGPGAIKQWALRIGLGSLPWVFAALRRAWPIPSFRSVHLVTLHDDVREVLKADAAFMVPYGKKLEKLLSEQVFIGMADTPAYRSQLGRLESLARDGDMAQLAADAEKHSEDIVEDAKGRLEVVDGLFRTVTFKVLLKYFGVPEPVDADLRVWSTRMFEYQFLGSDKSLVSEIDWMAPALLAHIEGEMERRRAAHDESEADLLGRALARQRQGEEGWDDRFIRTMIAALVYGGPPQPPMVLPQALEQLLRRPEALESAHRAAVDGDKPLLLGHILEALRFDPISPILPRVAMTDYVIAKGMKRAHKVAKGDRVIVAIQSAMADPHRIPSPKQFDPMRQPYEYIHFGLGLHECFGRHINRAIFPAIYAPLMRRENLGRVRCKAGRLNYKGFFPSSLTVSYD